MELGSSARLPCRFLSVVFGEVKLMVQTFYNKSGTNHKKVGTKKLLLLLQSLCDFIITDINQVGAFSLQNHIFGAQSPCVL